MSPYQRGHTYEAVGAFHVRFYETELPDGQLSCVQSVHVGSHTVSCAKDRKPYSGKSKLRQLLCDDFMRKVNTATGDRTGYDGRVILGKAPPAVLRTDRQADGRIPQQGRDNSRCPRSGP